MNSAMACSTVILAVIDLHWLLLQA
jgi:hypothetical protein